MDLTEYVDTDRNLRCTLFIVALGEIYSLPVLTRYFDTYEVRTPNRSFDTYGLRSDSEGYIVTDSGDFTHRYTSRRL